MQSIEIAESIPPTYLSTIGKRYKKEFNAHFSVIFATDDKQKIQAVWQEYLKLNIILINNIEKICVNLGCKVWDVIQKQG